MKTGDTAFVNNPAHDWFGLTVTIVGYSQLLCNPPIPQVMVEHKDGRKGMVHPDDLSDHPSELNEEVMEQLNDEGLRVFLNAFAHRVHQTAKDKGWWDDPSEDGTKIALMHSELSEALEALRHGNPPDDKIPEFSGVEAELADVIIRILDFAKARGHDVVGALVAKAQMNEGRAHKHGGKAF